MAQKLVQDYCNVAGCADEEVRAMILDANLPCVVDLREVVHGYWCCEHRIHAPKQGWWAWLLGQPAPVDTVLYEHHLEEKTWVRTKDHAVVVNESDGSEVEVGWTILLVGEDGRSVVAQARVSHREEYGWTTVSPSVFTRTIGRLSEPLVSTDQLLPTRWFPEPVDQGSGMYPAPDVFVSEAQEVLGKKLAELEAATAPKAGRRYHCPTCVNARGESCGEDDGRVGKFCCPTCAQHGGDQCGCGRAEVK